MKEIVRDCMIKERQIKALLHAIYEEEDQDKRAMYETLLKKHKEDKVALEMQKKMRSLAYRKQ